ncbi:MAG: phosphatase PAP2 family protein [bacterium]
MLEKIQIWINSLRKQEHRWKLYVFFGILAYFVLINQVIHIRPDHIFVALVLFSFVLGKARAKRFLIDWLPFVMFWIMYDMMRGVADSVREYVHITEPYRMEQWLFMPLLQGDIPPFFLQILRDAWHPAVQKFVSVFAANFYTAHFAVPLLLGWLLWHTADDRPMFYKFVYTLTILNVMALATFMLYPAAPPWYVYKYGFLQPDAGSTFWGISAGNLIDVDRLLGVSFFTTLWDSFNANHFAAIPSLHGAYPIVVSFFAWKKFRKYLPLLIFYPIATWFSAVYLNHHYIVDLLIAVLYILVAYAITTYLLYPKVFARFLEKEEGALSSAVEQSPQEEITN